MASIRNISTAQTSVLESAHVVGRAPGCALRVDKKYVSAQHAEIRWTGHHWEIKDLNSTNGTFLDGVRLAAREERRLRVGSTIGFGKLSEQQWELVDESAPGVMAVPVEGGAPVLLDGELIALPSSDDPQATIYRSAEGAWVVEQPGESITPITNLQTFEVAGRLWRFCCSEQIRTTSMATGAADLEVRHLQLSFSVSRDEEHVQLQMTSAGRTFDMGSRSHNYLLLVLARQRLEDARDGVAEAACGWIYQDDLAHDPTMAPPQLSLDVFRIRKQFGALGVVDAAGIIERRPRTRQLRVGTPYLSITIL
jgi:FHA domain